ncbi:hypothetical protein [uncultured Fibrella sp.]|uniref:hypothetical protein n=1 Tax=uncultured Fibrella sp. TaxID=1284596 RepID=UPI0035CB5EB5
MKYSLLSFALLAANLSVAQAVTNNSGTYTSITIYDPFQIGYNDVSGSPFIPEKGFATGYVTVGGTTPQKLKARYNTEAGQLEYLEKSKVLRMTTPVNEFRMVVNEGDTLLFRTGYSGKGELAKPLYCHVVYESKKATLIRSIISVIKKDEDPMSADFGKKRFVQREQSYLVVAKEITSVTPSKSSVLAAFPADQREAFTAVLNKQSGKLKTWADVKKVLTEYDHN